MFAVDNGCDDIGCQRRKPQEARQIADRKPFLTTNSVIHDLNSGCSYGTVWMPNVVDYTKVCFE